MHRICYLPGLRCIPSYQQHIFRCTHYTSIFSASTARHLCSSAILHSRPLRSQEYLVHVTRRSSLNAIANKVRPLSVQNAVRSYSSSSSPSEYGKLIYTGNLGKAVLGVKFFSYSSSMFSLCVMPYVLMKTGIGVESFALKVIFCTFIGFFTFMTPVLLHLLTKGYVLRLYHNEETDTYTAITYSALLVEKKTVFHQKDVRIPSVSQMFTSFYAKNHSMLVNPMNFPLPQDYNHLMGYDQPFSFDLDEVNKPDKN
ncbi:transmembrane protein 70, mitochondrial [Chanos chanos]|uniref:Transmembrane protein 70, mitochondrial n=1 Tax=Chanos chanos TaxID=29144 RepID=A0A6J2VHV9_CHACN|nr:transmembrane protein 70, mitochondrial [Chanos chanos]